jgi:XTP/dITP diphosphohydrolase
VELVLASRNTHKLRELGVLLAPHRIVLLGPETELPPETGSTFAENALAKARAAAASGRPALGEDSGIELPGLGGAPGVRSARFAGRQATDEQNLRKLLSEAEGLDDRAAAYSCALAFVDPSGEEKLFEGRCDGRLALSPRGSGGFGYDPIFEPAELPNNATMAQLSDAEKNAISHRGRAARLLLEWLSRR